MTGYYDYTLVVASFVVAVLASYSALYFGAQLANLEGGKARLWLTLGALSMGTGVWVMHFVGMQAYVMPVETSYDLTITVVSWLAAVGASGLALYIIGKERIGNVQFAIGSLFMAGGIVSMHYVGMAALQMEPGMSYDPVLFTASLAIALVASAVALLICRCLQSVDGLKGMAFQFGAALIMGVAICGMHYTGMAAMIYPDNAMPAADNLLSGDWLGAPLALVSGALIFVALVISGNDVKHRRNAELLAQAESERVERKALYDAATGLPNRASLANHLVGELAGSESDDNTFAVLYLDVANHREIPAKQAEDAMATLASAITAAIDQGVYLARYSSSSFVVIVNDPGHRKHKGMYQRLRNLPTQTEDGGVALTWRTGHSVFPNSGRNSRMLLRKAMKTAELSTLGNSSVSEQADSLDHFGPRSALPEA
ncbi:MHYT domain-containing protein [Marinobacter sp. SS13-12]|uniref:MHYT domain-containing protein n=1 Tax=Marinobacter sp. SS13-12 TaxID=3050451 RepID=UPI0025531736|nr:MHYT domain-containing protein [Marinobacter sp. SS13-12]MDK8462658.1 MHYT domain-containing protein [Marinobacter sp. SS13-12]